MKYLAISYGMAGFHCYDEVGRLEIEAETETKAKRQATLNSIGNCIELYEEHGKDWLYIAKRGFEERWFNKRRNNK